MKWTMSSYVSNWVRMIIWGENVPVVGEVCWVRAERRSRRILVRATVIAFVASGVESSRGAGLETGRGLLRRCWWRWKGRVGRSPSWP